MWSVKYFDLTTSKNLFFLATFFSICPPLGLLPVLNVIKELYLCSTYSLLQLTYVHITVPTDINSGCTHAVRWLKSIFDAKTTFYVLFNY